MPEDEESLYVGGVLVQSARVCWFQDSEQKGMGFRVRSWGLGFGVRGLGFGV